MWKASRNIYVLTLVACTAAAARAVAFDLGEAVTSIELGFNKELLAAVDPIDKTLALIGNSICEPVTKAVVPDTEPDLSQLTLQFRSPEITIIFNLTTAEQEISERYSQYFNPNNTQIIFLHGFTDNPSKTNFVNFNAALEKIGQFNILALDASDVIGKYYLKSAASVKYIGIALGKALAALCNLKGQLPEKIHCIGHSLGAHIAAFAGYTFFLLTGFKIGRITGLDPAGPCFANLPKYMKLNDTAADYVDVIHTDCGVFGIAEIVGHADFFVNGGSQQPGCPTQSCSHSRAVDYFTESVTRPNAFLAVPCSSYEDFRKGNCSDESVMGFYSPNTTRGVLYLQTSDTSPYGLGKNGTSYNKKDAGVIQKIQYGFGDLLGLS